MRGIHTLFGGLGATPFTEIPYKNTFLLLNNETWFPKQGIRFVIDVEHMYRSVGYLFLSLGSNPYRLVQTTDLLPAKVSLACLFSIYT